MNHHGAGDSVARRRACKVEGLLNMVWITLPQDEPRGLLGGVVQQPAHLLGVQTRPATSGGGGSKRCGDTVGTPVTRVLIGLGAQGHRDPRPDVIAEGYSAQQMRPVDAELLSGCERGRHHRAAWMRLRRSV